MPCKCASHSGFFAPFFSSCFLIISSTVSAALSSSPLITLRIDIQRDGWISVPETLRDCSQRNAPGQQLGSMGMSQVVEPGVSCTDAPREGDVRVGEIVRS